MEGKENMMGKNKGERKKRKRAIFSEECLSYPPRCGGMEYTQKVGFKSTIHIIIVLYQAKEMTPFPFLFFQNPVPSRS